PRAQVGQLEIAHLFPVDHMRMKVVAAVAHDALDVRHRQFAVPPCIDMNDEWPQSLVAHLQRKIGAGDATAQADDAVVFASASAGADGGADGRPASSSLLVRKPVPACHRVELTAVSAYALIVE